MTDNLAEPKPEETLAGKVGAADFEHGVFDMESEEGSVGSSSSSEFSSKTTFYPPLGSSFVVRLDPKCVYFAPLLTSTDP